ncbi:MAG: hypothetical protein ABI885_29455 [Gammaproteobacteria bacterium]
MRKTVSALLLVLAVFVTNSASAQVATRSYVVGSAGAWSNPFASGLLLGAGGGSELTWARTVGVGAELGALMGGADIAVTASMSGIVRLTGRQGTGNTTVPFVAAGFTGLIALTDTGESHAWHLRAGVDWRPCECRQIRFEFIEVFRGHAWTDHYSLARIGVLFG